MVKFLAERGLPFRGRSEVFGQPDNGNFMDVLEGISKFDPFSKVRIEKYGNAGKGTPSYLSSKTCMEFIVYWTDGGTAPRRDNWSDKNGKVLFDHC